eukprot:1159957-Pelagomonas_calceolata.AAC.8
MATWRSECSWDGNGPLAYSVATAYLGSSSAHGTEGLLVRSACAFKSLLSPDLLMPCLNI